MGHSYVTKSDIDALINGINRQREAYESGHTDPANVQKTLIDSLNKMGEKNPFLSQITKQLSGIMGGLITPYLHDQGQLPYSYAFNFDGDVVPQNMLTERDEFTPNPKYATPYKVATANYRRKSFKEGESAKIIADQLETLKESVV